MLSTDFPLGGNVARLSWLHLSNLLLGPRGSGLLHPKYRDALEQDLRKMHARSGPWDLVLVSGTLTQTGTSREFELLDSTLESIWRYLRHLGSDPCLLVVPGLWDVRMSQESQQGTLAFIEWFEAWRRSHPSPLLQSFSKGALLGDFVATVEKKGLKVGVGGLTSLFQMSLPGNSAGTGQVDTKKFESVTLKSLRTWAHEQDFLLMLTSHPTSVRHATSLARFLETMVPPKGFALHLCGKGAAAPDSSPHFPSKGVLTLEARSLFSQAEHEKDELKSGGYIVGQLEVDDSLHKGRARFFPRVAMTLADSVVLVPDEALTLGDEESFEIPILTLLNDARGVNPRLGRPSLPARTPARPSVDAGADIRAIDQMVDPPDLPPGVKSQQVLSAGTGSVHRLAWTPSGDALAVGLSDGRLAYWKPGAVATRWVKQLDPSGSQAFCFSPHGHTLASCSPREVALWRAADGAPAPGSGFSLRNGVSIAWSSGHLLAAGTLEGTLHLWNMNTSREEPVEVRTQMSEKGLQLLAWAPDGQTLACAGEGDPVLKLWKAQGPSEELFTGHQGAILDMAWMPGSTCIATASQDKTLRVMDAVRARAVAVLEGHTDAVIGVSFSFDGRLLASKSFDGTMRLFRTDVWEEVARIQGGFSLISIGKLAFSPKEHVLASVGGSGRWIRLWDIDIDTLLRASKPSTTVHAVSAKVVLVGEGRSGKSCLASRMAQDRYEELGSTHGMRFWSLPAEHSDSGGGATARTQRELILWDMGGQEEYRLVHQLFLRDSTVALMVMEPGRGQSALDELEGWNQRLLTQLGERTVRKLLVGTKVDDEHAPVDSGALEHFAKQHEFVDSVLTSARTGRGIPELKSALSRAIDWNVLDKVSRPELFQHLRNHIQRLKELKRVVLTFTDLEDELRRDFRESFDPDALQTVVAHLARQGLVADTRMADGTRALILEVEQVERYAGSLILAARENPHEVPAIDVAKVQSPTMRFPRIRPEERLRRDQELIVLDCVIQLLLEHGLCLRHEGLLIFPSLFRPNQTEGEETDFPHAISLHYDFSGPIDNIYASLVTSLTISRGFGPVRLWKNRAEFGRAGENTSGLRRVQQPGQRARGHARLDVYFDIGTPQSTRELFVLFIEEHLARQGVKLLERLSVTCACGKVFTEDDVKARLDLGHSDIGCPVCDRRTPLTPGAQQVKERNPEIARQLLALRTQLDKQRAQSITETKVSMTGAKRVTATSGNPIRILHLSDLHVGAGDDPIHLLQPLMADLNDPTDGLGVECLDYLVISGDITNRATPEEFEKAHAFVSELIQRLGLTAERCIIVPGNHDLHWDTEVYTVKKKRQVGANELVPGRYHQEGEAYFLRDDARYPERFRNFSQHFYHPLFQKEYPLSPEQQCIPTLFTETRLQFLAMNSAWEIDEFFRERSSIHEAALSRGLDVARHQLDQARKAGTLSPEAQVLRLAVWHHPITGNEKIQADAFMSKLAQADVRACLHGHVHEDRAELVNHLHPTRKVHIMGAGSFGAPTADRPESVPRLFNLLQVQRDLGRISVHTRCLRKEGGAWEGWARWPGPSGSKLTYYDIDIPQR
jgi:small GTP-binding protein